MVDCAQFKIPTALRTLKSGRTTPSAKLPSSAHGRAGTHGQVGRQRCARVKRILPRPMGASYFISGVLGVCVSRWITLVRISCTFESQSGSGQEGVQGVTAGLSGRVSVEIPTTAFVGIAVSVPRPQSSTPFHQSQATPIDLRPLVKSLNTRTIPMKSWALGGWPRSLKESRAKRSISA